MGKRSDDNQRELLEKNARSETRIRNRIRSHIGCDARLVLCTMYSLRAVHDGIKAERRALSTSTHGFADVVSYVTRCRSDEQHALLRDPLAEFAVQKMRDDNGRFGRDDLIARSISAV